MGINNNHAVKWNTFGCAYKKESTVSACYISVFQPVLCIHQRPTQMAMVSDTRYITLATPNLLFNDQLVK